MVTTKTMFDSWGGLAEQKLVINLGRIFPNSDFGNVVVKEGSRR